MIDTIPSEIINWGILNEIISMDEDDPDFSKGLITQYIDQVNTTFGEMESQLNGAKDLHELDNLGHFLKGSSAALGQQRIAWVCERIQNLGRRLEKSFPGRKELLDTLPANIVTNNIIMDDEEINVDTSGDDDSVYLNLIRKALAQARIEFKLARRELSNYYKTEL